MLLALTLLLALSVRNLGVAVSLVGSTGSFALSYVLPGWCYYRLMPSGTSEDPSAMTTSMGVVLRYLALIQFCIGIALMPICTGLILFT